MINKFFLRTVLFLIVSQNAMAVETLVDMPSIQPKGLVVVAPAKKYLMHERLFLNLARKISESGYIVVRLNWSELTLSDPEFEAERAAADINQVIKNNQAEYGFSSEQTVLISKSFSTKVIGQSIDLAKKQILLTPNCSTEASFEKTYDYILARSDIELAIIISNEDPYCDVRQIYQTLAKASKLPVLLTLHGDHNFVLRGLSATDFDFKYQDQVIRDVSDLILNF